MNYLGAMLLMCMGQCEEGAFWVLAALIDPGGELPSTAHQPNFSITLPSLTSSHVCGEQHAEKRRLMPQSSYEAGAFMCL